MSQTEDKTTLLEEMRSGRESANTAFINFTDSYDYFPTHIFCFYEGEDGKYYNQKIKTVLGDNVISIKVGNKKEVIKIWRKIKADTNYDGVSKCFFVDRDMDEPPEDIDKNLYITPCYSIENLYISQNVFANILKSEFSCDIYDEDYSKCMDAFTKLQNQFNEIMLEYNALILIRKRKELGNGKVSLSKYKTSNLVVIDINKVQKHYKYEEMIDDLKKELSASEDDISKSISELKSRGDYNTVFRGKNQLDFFASLIMELKKLHRDNQFFARKHCSVSINITSNRLSELSQYAEFPDCLKEFLIRHKKPA